jgi:mono/diheme cytochrome c family protein
MRIYLFVAFIALTALTSQSAPADQADGKPSGQAVFDHWCLPCHGAGPHHPATAALEFKYRGITPAALEQRTDLTPEFVEYLVRHGAGNMAPFRKTEVTDADLDALTRYLSHGRSAH